MSRFNREAHLKEFLPHVNIIDSSEVYVICSLTKLVIIMVDNINEDRKVAVILSKTPLLLTLSKYKPQSVTTRCGFHSKQEVFNLHCLELGRKRIKQKIKETHYKSTIVATVELV